MGENEKALEYYNKSLGIQIKVHRLDHPDTASTYTNIGMIYDEMGEHEMALRFYNKTLDITIKVHGPDKPDVATPVASCHFFCSLLVLCPIRPIPSLAGWLQNLVLRSSR